MSPDDADLCPRILGLFQKRIDGDDSLMQLASLRFKEAALGIELYAENQAELDRLLSFKPFRGSPVVVHLSRQIDLFKDTDRKAVIAFAERNKEQLYGLVIHDQAGITDRFDEYLSALKEIEAGFKQAGRGSLLFIEYAVGLEPGTFIRLFREIKDLERISACVDVGHIGIRQARDAYSRKYPGVDICGLSPDDPALPSLIEDVQKAVGSSQNEVVRVIRELGQLGKPLHFHLHDAHPLSVSSPFGVSDHLSFLDEIQIPFEYEGKTSLAPMFGPSGLSSVVDESLKILGPAKTSFSLEIHPPEARLPLGHASSFFNHWIDKTNAERMNYWLSVLLKNHHLLLKACRQFPEISKKQEKRASSDAMIIYNLFPLLAGKFSKWGEHISRAADMGFTWIFVNPIQVTGSSGSLYSIADYFAVNPLFVDTAGGKSSEEQVKEMIKESEGMGLRVMIDLVINHCSVDAEILRKHPEWFLWEAKGRVAHPFAMEDGRKVVWKDLAKFDHRNTRDSEGLFKFFLSITDYLAELGFRGFRCDAAYQLPRSLWERLIGETRKKYPDVVFLAETLGNPPDLTRKTASAGFDYIFNSSKWWDFSNPWLMEQYALTRDIAPSISFPESHDTARLCEELNGNIDGLKQRYLFSSIFSGGLMTTMGYEFGFRKKPHVVKTRPSDWEETYIDLTSFITKVNRMKAEHPLFQEEAPSSILYNENPNLLLIWKASTRTREEALIILNKDIYNKQHFYTETLQKYLQAGAPLMDISPEDPLYYIPTPFSYELWPGQGIVLITSRDVFPED